MRYVITAEVTVDTFNGEVSGLIEWAADRLMIADGDYVITSVRPVDGSTDQETATLAAAVLNGDPTATGDN